MFNKLERWLNKSKNKFRLGIFTISTLLWLSWCGNTSWDNWYTNWKEVIKVNIQAWIVVWADVEIKTLSWMCIWNYVTNNNWEIFIDKQLIDSKLNELWLSNDEPLEFISSWGIDIDPDDDWNPYNDIDQNLTWKMSALSSLSEISNWYINPLSSLVNDILKEKTANYSNILNASWEVNTFEFNIHIDEILTWVWAIDKNNDWNTDLNDVIHYNMVDDNSPLETSIINNWYLDYLHDWNTDFENQFVTNLWTTWWPISIDWHINIPTTTDENVPDESNFDSSNNLNSEEVNKYYVWNSYEKLKTNFINLSNSSKYYVLWLWDWAFQSTKDSVEMIQTIPQETINWLVSYGSLLVDSITFWWAKSMHLITWNEIYADIRDTINDEILSESLSIQQEVEKFYNEIWFLKQEITNAISNLDWLEQPEYWGWYLNWYLDVLIAQWVTMTIATKNAAKVIAILKKSKWYLLIKKITARINVSWEIFKATLIPINLNKLANLYDEFWWVYWVKTEEIIKKSYIIAREKWINEKTLIHLLYGEWGIVNWEKRLRWWLHNMNVVEEMLRDDKIIVWIKKNWRWIEITKEEYFNLPKDSYDRLNPRIKWVNDSRKINQIWKNQKSLFPSNWTDEEIAEVVKKAEDNIKAILLNEYNLPLKWEAWVYWKQQAVNDKLLENWEWIYYKVKLDNWEPIELDLWWRYDSNWNLDFRINTLYPKY